MKEDALTRLARVVAEDVLEPDPDTLSVLSNAMIDTLGCIHLGARTDLAQKARDAVVEMSAAGTSQVIGTEMQTSRPQAAFLNAVAGHALDFDDWEYPGNTHPTTVLFPALLAVATQETSGPEFAKAYLAGFEVIARIGEGINFEHYNAGWHSTATLGAPGAAAACSRLLGLTAAETAHAMSIAISTASGFACQFGADAKPLQAGFAARAGVEAACLAEAGLAGNSHILDHPRGMAALMGGLVPERLENALQKIGTGYALSEHGLVVKPWPSCGYSQRIMTCATGLSDRVTVDHVAGIDLHLPDFHAAVATYHQPESRSEALFSLPFVAAMGLVHHRLTVADLDSGLWEDDIIRDLIGKTKVHPFAPRRPDLNYAQEDPDRMVVTFTDGNTLEEACIYPLGAPQAPMSSAQIWAKFDANLGPQTEAHASRRVWSAQLQNWTERPSVLSLFTAQGRMQ